MIHARYSFNNFFEFTPTIKEHALFYFIYTLFYPFKISQFLQVYKHNYLGKISNKGIK